MPPKWATATQTIHPRDTTAQEGPTSAFIPPPACSTALATLIGGDCSGYPNITCETWSPDEIMSKGGAQFNFLYRNESNMMTGALDCFPPEYTTSLWVATGCPDGFTTAEAWSDTESWWRTDAITTTGICCPSGYSKAWLGGNEFWQCTQILTATGQTMLVEAYGVINTADDIGFVNGTLYPGFFQTFSPISTTVINTFLTGTQPPITIWAGGIGFTTYTPPATTPLPSTTSCGYDMEMTPPVCRSSLAKPKFSIVHIGLPGSIVVTVFIIIAGCGLLGWLAIWSRRKPKPVVYQHYHAASSTTVVASTLQHEEYDSPITAVTSREHRIEVDAVPMTELSGRNYEGES